MILNSAYSNQSRYQSSAETDNFDQLDQICPKRVILINSRKLSTTIEFFILELVQVPNFKINWQFRFFRPNLPKNGICGRNRKKVNITTEFCIFKLEEDNYIFLAGGNALVYLAKPMHKKCSTAFAWGHPFSTYVSYDRC